MSLNNPNIASSLRQPDRAAVLNSALRGQLFECHQEIERLRAQVAELKAVEQKHTEQKLEQCQRKGECDNG